MATAGAPPERLVPRDFLFSGEKEILGTGCFSLIPWCDKEDRKYNMYSGPSFFLILCVTFFLQVEV
jgi:hypothetical protein